MRFGWAAKYKDNPLTAAPSYFTLTWIALSDIHFSFFGDDLRKGISREIADKQMQSHEAWVCVYILQCQTRWARETFDFSHSIIFPIYIYIIKLATCSTASIDSCICVKCHQVRIDRQSRSPTFASVYSSDRISAAAKWYMNIIHKYSRYI